MPIKRDKKKTARPTCRRASHHAVTGSGQFPSPKRRKEKRAHTYIHPDSSRRTLASLTLDLSSAEESNHSPAARPPRSPSPPHAARGVADPAKGKPRTGARRPVAGVVVAASRAAALLLAPALDRAAVGDSVWSAAGHCAAAPSRPTRRR
jgi:hypothetical protein